MVAKFNRKIRRGGNIFMAILGFFIVFFFPGIVGKSHKASFAHIAHADAPAVDDGSESINPTTCGAPGCCGSCGDGSAADCGGSGSSSSDAGAGAGGAGAGAGSS